MNGQNLQFLQGRTGGTVEPVRVGNELVKNKNQDDGAGPDKDSEGGQGGGAKSVSEGQC